MDAWVFSMQAITEELYLTVSMYLPASSGTTVIVRSIWSQTDSDRRANGPSFGSGSHDSEAALRRNTSHKSENEYDVSSCNMNAEMNPSTGTWIQTPLIYSSHISDRLGCSAYLKLENLQPSQSFKYRGVSLRVQELKAQFGPALHVFIASSGNAGLAAAVAARNLQVRCTVYLPVVVAQATQDMLRKQGADVVSVGQIYSEALKAMYEATKEDPNAVVLSGYDDPVLWKGHSSMVEEMKSQLHNPPDAIFCAVGGGGLIGGILLGSQSIAGWDNVPVVSLETHGSNCFYHAISLNTQGFGSKTSSLPSSIPPEAPYTVQISEEYQVAIPYMRTLTSRAASLGATSPAPGVVRMALDHAGEVKCVCISDEFAMSTARAFAGEQSVRHIVSSLRSPTDVDEHKFLLELACATTMSPAYSYDLFWRILDSTSKLSAEEKRKKNVIFIVCGGVKVTFDELSEYDPILDRAAEAEREWKVICNGTEICVPK
ncbi:tryptophan synthase beta subunit-like PLP-dependent enzyme [Chiua virens]|nr:tryptophan synthase beta subunit-like PLP-dependent enzyme [Chiua virens]